jgi:hypothetical protein
MKETQTQRLAREHLTTVVDVAISNIKQIQKWATYIVYAIMGVSYFHQFGYLFKTLYVAEFFSLGTLEGYMHAVTNAVGALLIPVIFDFFTLLLVKAGSTLGLKRWVRKTALCLVAAPVGASAYINFKGSVDPTGKFVPAIGIVYLMVVAFIALTELMRMGSHEIDYPAIQKMEMRAAAHVGGSVEGAAEQEGPAKDLDPMMQLVLMGEAAAKEAVGYDRMTPEQKQGWMRRFNSAKRRMGRELADPVSAVRSTVKEAPVSPAAPRA